MASVAIPPLPSETVLHIGQFGVRNTLIMAVLTSVVLTVLALLGLSTGYKLVPGRFQTALELLVGGFFDFVDSVMENRTLSRRFLPLILTFFLYILVGNWLGILPGVGSIFVVEGHEHLPLLRSMNADVNMTLALAALSVVVTHVSGIVALGPFGYAGKFLVPPWRKPYVVGTFVGILELVSEVAKLISFTFRLFGNIFAGEVLLTMMTYFTHYIVPVPFYGMEVFVGFIQAFVFSVLTLIFIKLAMTGHEDHDHAEALA